MTMQPRTCDFCGDDATTFALHCPTCGERRGRVCGKCYHQLGGPCDGCATPAERWSFSMRTARSCCESNRGFTHTDDCRSAK